MTRDPERCPTTGELVDACRHCIDDLPCDTPTEHEETPVSAPPLDVDQPPPVEVVATLTWTAHVSAPRHLLDQLAARHGLDREQLLTLVAASRVHADARFRGRPLPLVFDPRVVVSAVTLVDTDVQALP